MRDLGVAVVGESAFLWEFDGTAEERDQVLAALAAAADDDD